MESLDIIRLNGCISQANGTVIWEQPINTIKVDGGACANNSVNEVSGRYFPEES